MARQSTTLPMPSPSTSPAHISSHRLGSSDSAHPPVREYGVYSTSMLSTWRPVPLAMSGSSTEGTLAYMLGRSATRPSARSLWASISSSGLGKTVRVGLQVSRLPWRLSIPEAMR